MWLPATARHDQIKHSSIPLLEFVPNTTPTALLIQMTVLDQVAEMLLQNISADTRTAVSFSTGSRRWDTAMVCHKLRSQLNAFATLGMNGQAQWLKPEPHRRLIWTEAVTGVRRVSHSPRTCINAAACDG
jgi:hypothetical protein